MVDVRVDDYIRMAIVPNYIESDNGVEYKLTNGDHYIIKPNGNIIIKGGK